MQKIILTTILLLFIKLNAVSQVDTLKWINEHAHELRSITQTDQSDFSFLKEELKEKEIVGLGEASHGTHEFYTEKARIISYLIENCDFRTVAFEVPDSIMMQIDSFIQTGQGDLKKTMKGMGLYGVEEIYQLFLTLRDYNKSNAGEKRVKLIGFDKPEYWSDPISRDGLMAENVIKIVSNEATKMIIWAHNVHLLKDTTAQYLCMGGYITKHFGDRYFALALDTYEGSVNVLNQGKFEAHVFKTNLHTLSRTMSKAQARRFYLKFNTEDDPFKGALEHITNIYSNWNEPKPIPMRPGIDFDAVLFIKNTTPSIQLK
nr:erythromycin esterase family protein [Pedobacter panaciterrae]